jgi:hypothetical protein
LKKDAEGKGHEDPHEMRCSCRRGVFFFSPNNQRLTHAACFKVLMKQYLCFEAEDTKKEKQKQQRTFQHRMGRFSCIVLALWRVFKAVFWLGLLFGAPSQNQSPHPKFSRIDPVRFCRQVCTCRSSSCRPRSYSITCARCISRDLDRSSVVWYLGYRGCSFYAEPADGIGSHRSVLILLIAVWAPTVYPLVFGNPACQGPVRAPFGLTQTDIDALLTITIIFLGTLLAGYIGILDLDVWGHSVPADLAYARLREVEEIRFRPLWGQLSLPSREASLHMDQAEVSTVPSIPIFARCFEFTLVHLPHRTAATTTRYPVRRCTIYSCVGRHDPTGAVILGSGRSSFLASCCSLTRWTTPRRCCSRG